MAKKIRTTDASIEADVSKDQLQRQMARTRESIAETVGEIKETVEQEVKTLKKGAASILNFRGEFEKDPFVWSLGALSAGFALGYTVGYAHKNSKGRKKGEIAEFADTMMEQLSQVGRGMVMPALDAKISELFGFEFSGILDRVGKSDKPSGRKKGSGRTKAKLPAKAAASKKPGSAAKKTKKS